MDSIQPLLFWVIALLTGLSAIATVVSQNIVRSATWLLFTLAGTSGIFFLLGADLVGAIQLLVYVGGTLVLVVFGVMLTAQGPFINMKTSGAEWAISALVGLLLLGVLGLGIISTGKPATAATNAHAANGRLVTETAPFAKLAADYKAQKIPKAEFDEKWRELVKLRDDNQRELVKLRDDYQAKKITKDVFDEKKAALDEKWQAVQPSAAAFSPYSSTIGQGFLGVGVGPAHNEIVGDQKVTVHANYLLPFEIVSVHLLVVLIAAAYLARAKRRRVA
jgi:NADH:ubiquinone oxidoreductase subunit 6 (subunit J)